MLLCKAVKQLLPVDRLLQGLLLLSNATYIGQYTEPVNRDGYHARPVFRFMAMYCLLKNA